MSTPKRTQVKPGKYSFNAAIEAGRVEIESYVPEGDYDRSYHSGHVRVYLDGTLIGTVSSEVVTESRPLGNSRLRRDLKPKSMWSYRDLKGDRPYAGYRRNTRLSAIEDLVSDAVRILDRGDVQAQYNSALAENNRAAAALEAAELAVTEANKALAEAKADMRDARQELREIQAML